MTKEEAVEVLEATPLMRMERKSDVPLSELGEAMRVAIETLNECIGCPCWKNDGCMKDDMK